MASKYTSHGVQLTQNQKDKIHRAVKQGVSVNIKLSHSQLMGSDQLPLTQTQVKNIGKAHSAGVGYVLNLSVPQVKHIVSGGFLPLLLGALGALATGALSGAASYGATKLLKKIDGSGFGESYIQNASAIGKGMLPQSSPGMPPIGRGKKQAFRGGAHQYPPSYGLGVSAGFQGQGLFTYGQPTARVGRGMVKL